ncbi:ABC transporter substrate-binding protein [Agrobacterium vitis]|uniref:Glycine/betaine ABC transporter substrate-binding protein n=1 Tax=Agrobacterium vitis TaxID=373 RepID=A0AAE5AVV2_AGRVI|nr:ABC transporter substrate-binding protein [Agrobacterium vitis]MCF1501474.1 ABC transporter substrate-binding protein [Allorhizobium sp. Av2]MCM2439626.1 ABC transporter substrate-binding protein [Agrobacterium vitis]MUZ57475.1 glycine/betaine ABC transporter substrate-binding protein [Agrobacterium vitis]MVA68825.1 glycine/betaine ABC transporter substrate-binding protein [Agrobacterium vitis]MVA87941.1 glycine/betaine ABC transporter substrate-binding protein [Agrobacterium vitis]
MAFRIITAVSALALMTLSAASVLAAGDPLAAPPTERTDTKTIIVGSADFPESQLLATIYAKALTAKGIKVETKLNIGSREVYMPALLDGSIDLLPEYAGAALSYLDKKATAHTPDDVAAALKAALPKGVSMLTPSAAQDSDGVAVTRATAEKYKLKTIADLAPVASEFVLGGPPEWKTRKEGIIGLKDVYGLEFKSLKALDVGGPLTLSALVNGQIQAANLFSTDPAIATNDLVMLEDVKNLFPAQNVVPVIATAKVSETVTKTLDAVSAALTTKDLVVMNGRLGNHDSFDVVAGDWLAQHKLN